MKNKLINAFKYLLFLGIGVFLFWYVYKDQNFNDVLEQVKNIDYFWLWIALIFGLLSHISRAMRWQLLVQPLGYKPSFWNSFFAVMSTYIANLAVPRLGEVTRPTLIKKYEKIPFSTTLGTIILERIIDVLILLVLTIFVTFIEYDVLLKFIDNNPEVSDKFKNLNITKLIIAFAVIGIITIIGIVVFIKKFKHTKVYKKISEMLLGFLSGLKSINKVDKKFQFIFHSIFIWTMYFLMIYVSFYAFGNGINELSIMAGLAVFVAGSYGMVAPVQGGIGAWHFMIIATLVILGINDGDAKVFALVVHSIQTLLIIVVGAISLILMPVVNRNKLN